MKMARAEVSQTFFSSNHSNISCPLGMNGPLPKRSRLSLRRTTKYSNAAHYKEDDSCDVKQLRNQEMSDKNVEMIDLTQDENASPNCISSIEMKSEVKDDLDVKEEEEEEEENEIKVWTLGLPNCGNTCFINSILQVLRYTPDFINSLHSLLLAQHQVSRIIEGEEESKEMIFFKYMHSLFSAMKRKEALMRIHTDKDYCAFLLKPVKLVISSLREFSLLFEEGEQHDAHELLITTISAFCTACQSVKKYIKKSDDSSSNSNSPPLSPSTSNSEPRQSISNNASAGQKPKKKILIPKRRKPKSVFIDNSVIENLNTGFEGKVRHVVQCLECEKRIEREEVFSNLELNIPQDISGEDTVHLHQCMSQTTILCGENKYFCDTCKHRNEARISSEVIKLPPILLLHFGCTISGEEENAEKSSMKVIIPRSLNTSENSDVFCSTPDQNYKLFAVVLHLGRSVEGGHYVSFIKDASQDIISKEESNEKPILTPKLRTTQCTIKPENCCSTEAISNFKTMDTTTKWLLFDDNVVSPVVIDEDTETFPYFNYLSITATPCMIFYHKT
ncbi:ubiquitin carboxyl-terminal hydrolase 46 [Caerostris extrusa]|uniref:Ubiquitin carboxyl-terminal hydrolase n=1 Tax=Caerostris extrusa TaxID=172846 RepID=A0AAV4N527_CAEEX|nr:ubiquitin carboxyl-terminal hydrolase 46 [Caerostris extrusa]